MPTVNLTYKEGVPSWEISPPDPNTFKGVRKSVIFRMFYFPEGALLASFTKLYDMPDQPYLFHRILDISDALCKKYIESLISSGQVLLVFKDEKQEYFTELVSVPAGEIKRLLSEGESYNKKLGVVSGNAALDKFGTAFGQYFPKLGAEGSWDAVERHYQAKTVPPPQGEVQAQFQTEGLHAPGLEPEVPAGNKSMALYWLIGYAVVAAGAWFIAGRGLWLWTTIISGILVLGFLFGLKDALSSSASKLSVIKTYLLVIGLWVLWLVIGIKFAIAPVYIDNYSGYKVLLKLGGKDWFTLEDSSNAETRLRRGAYELVIIDALNNGEIKRMTINVESGDPHILNVLGKMSYYKGTAVYSTYSYGLTEPAGSTITSEWFEADVDYLFEEPPGSMQIKQGTTAYKSYLRREGAVREAVPYEEEEKKPEDETPPPDEFPEENPEDMAK
ncbi:MAG: hypothetical protein HY811_05675 [Planctomycetes bacterium]|nr:hypothetical protein [Planctomycetota bacterium]